MRFNVLSRNGSLFGLGGSLYVINLDKSLPPMQMGGWGDPHMTLKIKNGSILARWDDNVAGSEGKELLFFYLETQTDTISVFYTYGLWGNGAKIITSARYIHNGTSYNLSGVVTVGPVTISRYGFEYSYLDLYFDKIDNVKKFGGGFAIALAASQAVGGYVDGSWGPNIDGYQELANFIKTKRSFNFSTSDLIVGQGVSISNNIVSLPSVAVFDTDSDDVQKILGFANANCIGARATSSTLPLDPVALQNADLAKPGGDFDGLINPPENSNGIIDALGNTGPGLQVFGVKGIPESLSSVGTHNAGGGPGGPGPYGPYPQSILEKPIVISWE